MQKKTSDKMTNTHKHQSSHNFVILAWFVYLALLIYGTLYPINEWNWDQGSLSDFFTFNIPDHVSSADLVMNIIVYVPFGFLSFLLISNRSINSTALFWTTLSGFLLSFSLEFLQQFLPLRVTSLSDIFLNTLSTLIGSLLAYYTNLSTFQTRLKQWNNTYISNKPYSLLGASCVALWAAAQLSPFVPSIDFSYLRHGIAPFWNTLNNLQTFIFSKFFIQALYLSGITLILRTSLTRSTTSYKLILVFLSSVLILKIPVLSRQLSLESSLGLLVAFTFLLLTYQISFQKLRYIILLFILAGYTYSTLIPGKISVHHAMNWIPFSQQMNTLVGIDDLIEQIAIFAAISFLIISGASNNRKSILLLGSAFVLFFSFSLEWFQQYVPGRYSDITDVFVAVSTWFFCILYPWNSQNDVAPTDAKTINRQATFQLPKFVYIIPIILILLVFGFLETSKTTIYDKYSLPEITDLPRVNFPYFKTAHPRLPVPSYADIFKLENEKRNFFYQHRNFAKRGKLYSRILIARVYPDEIDLNALYTDLMALKFSWRGHQQTKPLALAYDWLYQQWTPEQQKQLRNKVKSACEYQIKVIRDTEKLSPYNVYLYNSPFQAMVVAALAIHTDIPEADDQCMKFTYDYWINRVLPVWRQVMGTNGGWHEGGEYIGLGIGQAIYQVPALWRSATGEDFFQTEPGIKGFLDFLVYRTRPDGTHMRWGDAAHFDKVSPDRHALSIEFKHQAAYSLYRCPRPNKPSSWPWGPLTSDVFCNSEAINQLPLFRHFDGIGMVIARSGWNIDATYVSFKAGDNYWSHSHLDQGAFTIYKGGPLAIDSGLYGPKYGSDHHMNYSYQTIAHNVITISDKEDNLPLPDKKDKQKSRAIANDGGQRRVGSGWGKPAPLDLNEWVLKKDVYHTGKIEKFYSDEKFVIAIANLTPAYTNLNSGNNTFFDRTKRVEDYWRIFIYDRRNDIVIVYDNMTATNSAYTKRSLLHTMNQPYLEDNKIIAQVYAQNQPTQSGGILEASVLFPKKSYMNIIGGKGSEFLIQNKNYDENGNLWNQMKKRKKNLPEPGAWRVEIIPPFAKKNDQFLTVYNPKLINEKKDINITSLETQGRIGCHIKGSSETYSLLFAKTKHSFSIEIDDGVKPKNIGINISDQ